MSTQEMDRPDLGKKDWVGCDFCDSPGGGKTYEYQVRMPLSRKVQGIDHCIHRIIAALNAGGVLNSGELLWSPNDTRKHHS